jgi:hypothetical protein
MRRRIPQICLLIALVALSQRASSQLAFTQQIGQNMWVAGLPTEGLQALVDPATTGRQRKDNWCWAASIQMVLNADGIVVTQEQVVQRIFGDQNVDRGGTTDQMLTALTGWAFTRNGKPAWLYPARIWTNAQIVDNLSRGWPIIVALSNPGVDYGHAEVITAVTYSWWNGIPVIISLTLRDPWPYSESRTEMSWSEFAQRRTDLLSVQVAYPQGP